jgi:hypothetical protein
MENIKISAHCYNDSTGEYCLRLEWDELGTHHIRLGSDAVKELEDIFGRWDAPEWFVKEIPFERFDE